MSAPGGAARGARAGWVPRRRPPRRGRSPALRRWSLSERREAGRVPASRSLRPRRPDFPSRSFPSRARRRRPSPGFLTRRAAKIACGRISASRRRPDPAGQLGSSPRPTAEGPGSGRARGPGCPQAPLGCTLPPPFTLSCPASTSGWCLKSKLQLGGWDFWVGLMRIVAVPAVPQDGNNFRNSSSCEAGGVGRD